MAKSKKRPANSYIAAAKKLKIYAPGLAKYAKRKTLKPHEKSAIARKEKLLRHTENLIPVTAQQAKTLKRKNALVGNGIRAVRMRNTAPDAKVKIRNGQLFVESNGRTFEYVSVEAEPRSLLAVAEDIFNNSKNVTVWLWLNAGRAAAGYRTIELFAQNVIANFNQYQDAAEFILGLAYLDETPA